MSRGVVAGFHRGERHLPGPGIPGPAASCVPDLLSPSLPLDTLPKSSCAHPTPTPKDRGHRGTDSDPWEPNRVPAGGGHSELGRSWAGGRECHRHSADPAPSAQRQAPCGISQLHEAG